MNIIWLSWKDRGNPLSGGAESVSGNIMDKLVRDGHNVKLITANYPNAESPTGQNNFEVIRVGNRYTVYSSAKKYYIKHLKGWADVVIDEMNTIPFSSAAYSGTRNVLLCYQLAREVWLYQMVAPLSFVGYLYEPFMLRKLAKKYPQVATESQSTKSDMQKYGFKNIDVFRVGMDISPVKALRPKVNKDMVLSLGSVRPMKRTLDAVRAFELARDQNNALTMTIAGDTKGPYGEKVMNYIANSRHGSAITVLGRVTATERLTLMQKAGVILVTSVKEGWGLIVTEANSQGTPAVVYDVDGLRDSVQHNTTGIVSANSSPLAMSQSILNLLSNNSLYETMRVSAWEWSKQFTLENSYKDFLKIISRS